MCDADRRRCELTCRRINRDQAKENLLAHANTGAAEENEEKINGREVAHAEIDRNPGEIAFAETDGDAGKIGLIEEEKSHRESDSFSDAISESFGLREKEKIFAQPVSGVFSERIEQEKETQIFADSKSVTGRVAIGVRQSQPHSRSE